MKIERCKILRLHGQGQMMYELEVFYGDGTSKRGLRIPFQEVLGFNNVRRFPSVNKVRDWLNSEEGLKYLNKRFPL